MHALAVLILLSFGALLLAFLAAWWTLTLRERAARAARAEAAAPARAERRAARPKVSNDAVRGARAPRKRATLDASAGDPPSKAQAQGGVRVRPARRGEDAFERFLEPGRRDDF